MDLRPNSSQDDSQAGIARRDLGIGVSETDKPLRGRLKIAALRVTAIVQIERTDIIGAQDSESDAVALTGIECP